MLQLDIKSKLICSVCRGNIEYYISTEVVGGGMYLRLTKPIDLFPTGWSIVQDKFRCPACRHLDTIES